MMPIIMEEVKKHGIAAVVPPIGSSLACQVLVSNFLWSWPSLVWMLQAAGQKNLDITEILWFARSKHYHTTLFIHGTIASRT
jgi:hypothetical protein